MKPGGSQKAGSSAGRLGYTTGACAAAAAKAALRRLLGNDEDAAEVDIPFPDGERHTFPVVFIRQRDGGVEAAVRKDAGDDPDITHGCTVSAFVETDSSGDVTFIAGDGVGTVTKKGLSIPPGEPAINPGPRNMIRQAIRELTDQPVRVTISIPGGRELAQKTFNPRIGIVNGLSILGSTGRVRPFSCQALRCSLICELEVAAAAGVNAPVLVPGHIGERSARQHLTVTDEQVIEVGNEWGMVLELLSGYPFQQALIWGHPGKLAKLADRQWDTHSSRSGSAVDIVRRFIQTGCSLKPMDAPTTEGLFAALDRNEQARVAEALGAAIAHAAEEKAGSAINMTVVLVNLKGEVLGIYGDVARWSLRNNRV